MTSTTDQEHAQADILMIDDETELLELFQDQFSASQLSMFACHDPIDGLERFAHTPFPVVITDLRMPRLHGTEVIRRVKSLHPATTVFVITGHAASENILTCFRYGAADVFFKPLIAFDILLDEVKRALARYERWRSTLFTL